MKTGIYKTIDLDLAGKSRYILGRKLIKNLSTYLDLQAGQKVFILTDNHVWDLYGDLISTSFFWDKRLVKKFIVKEGEAEKNFYNLGLILEDLADGGFNKTDIILSVGGGVVGDLGGLAASLYQRGVGHVLVATTILAAIDSSVGGKTAINLSRAKNMVGTFKQADMIICDIDCFKTLDRRIFNEGLAEAIKYGLIASSEILNLLFMNLQDGKNILKLIEESIKTKYSFVKNDIKDEGVRQFLNFGHSLGHAIEQKSAYKLRHGEAVAIGMYYMTKLSEEKGILSYKKNGERLSQMLRRLLEKYDLPWDLPYPLEDLIPYMKLDKKIRGAYINLVLLNDLERPSLVKVEIEKMEAYLNVFEG